MTLLYQLADSAFPAGGFAHSAGLEAAAQAGEVRGPEGLTRFCREALWQTGRGALPLATAAHGRPDELALLDARCDAFLGNHVQNRASRTQGRAFVDTCARIYGGKVAGLRDGAKRSRLHLHHAPLFGAALGTLGVGLADAQRLLLWLALRGVLSAAVRLGIVGTHEAQSQQSALLPLLEEVLAACASLGPDDLAQTAPLVDLFSATQDRLYSRLFQS